MKQEMNKTSYDFCFSVAKAAEVALAALCSAAVENFLVLVVFSESVDERRCWKA